MHQKIDGTKDDAEGLDLVMPMHKLLEHSSNYSDRVGSLRFYSKNEATNFIANIGNNATFKSFMDREIDAPPAPNNRIENLKNEELLYINKK